MDGDGDVLFLGWVVAELGWFVGWLITLQPTPDQNKRHIETLNTAPVTLCSVEHPKHWAKHSLYLETRFFL